MAYTQRAIKLIRSYWRTAKLLEGWAAKVKDVTPYLVMTETASLSGKLNVTGVLTPFNPKGPHDGDNTLELHLKPGPPLTLADAILPITGVPLQIGKWKWAKKIARAVSGIIGTAVASVLTGNGSPIRMLEPEEDFSLRQKIKFYGYRPASSLPIPYLGAMQKSRFAFDAHAEPYGGGKTEMTWKSRLTEKPDR
jgi:hypothetical protein